MADINLNELRATAERLAGQTTGLKGDRLTIERAIAGDHFSPEVVLALLRRVAELEAKVARVEALCADAWFTGEIHRDGIREALAGEPDE